MKIRIILKTLLLVYLNILFIYSKAFTQKTKLIDSLYNCYNTAENDSVRIYFLCTIAGKYWFSKPDSSIKIAERALKIAENISSQRGIANSYHVIGYAYVVKGNYPLALSYNFKALKIREAIKDIRNMSKSYNNIGNIYMAQENYAQALVYYNKGYEIDIVRNDSNGIATKAGNIGTVYGKQKNYNKALEYHYKALVIDEKLKDSYSTAIDLLNIGEMYFYLAKYDLAIQNLEKSLRLGQETQNQEILSNVFQLLAEIYRINGNRSLSIEYGLKALKTAQEIKGLIYIKKAATTIYEVYQQNKDFENALHYYKIAANANDSMFSSEKNKEINRLQNDYELNRIKLLESDMKIAEQEIKNQNLFVAFLSVGIFLLLLLILAIFRSKQKEHKAKVLLEKQNNEIITQRNNLQILNAELLQKNEEITAQRDEIEAQRDEIEAQRNEITLRKNEIERKNNNITSSIIYASRIQQALLPQDDFFENTFDLIKRQYHCNIEHFIINKPRDIVSGDFYWSRLYKNYFFLTVADCTGHGVPGAFMSTLGISLLNEIVHKTETIYPEQILNELRDLVKRSLHQTNKKSESKDGMDIAFCVIDLVEKKLFFSGAYNPLFLLRKSENHSVQIQNESKCKSNSNDFTLIALPADRMPIGIHPKDSSSFSCQTIQLQNNDNLYMFSDGYISQFNGKNGNKYKLHRFREALLKIQNKTMSEQKRHLEETYDCWKGTSEQIDDILIVGLNFQFDSI